MALLKRLNLVGWVARQIWLKHLREAVKEVIGLSLLAKHDGVGWGREENLLAKHVGRVW